MSMYPVYILLISKHVSGIIITIFPVIHIGCCPHVCQRLLVYLWPTYQKLPISVWCMFPLSLLSVLVCYFIKLFLSIGFHYLARVFKVRTFVFALLLPYQARSVHLFEFQVSPLWIHLQRRIGTRGHYHYSVPLNLAPKPQTSFLWVWREVGA